VIESSQPAVIPRCVQSAQTPNQGMTGAKFPDLQRSDLRYARRLPAGGAKPTAGLPSDAPIGASGNDDAKY